ncbi:hydantoinase/oxoprolinase family protein [Aeoliella sp.]|uniref:hydantoinase/oxoprolinase family protein n=1 Tax=Aeoliella sp. TaxID=2795800 RepID=UPI003CCBFEEC
MTKWLGIDVGGANLKLADGRNYAHSSPFELWRHRDTLADAIESLLADAPAFDALAATMTGELADCYETKAEGVRHIAACLQRASADRQLAVYCVDGRFRDAQHVADAPLLAAASNWHALARYAARQLPERTGLVVDMGSTTTDVIPVVRGEVATASQTDTDRLLAGELVYTGAGRTPLCAIVRELPYRGRNCPIAAELFATTLDVYRVLGSVADASSPTADGRSASVANCIDRLARQVCADRESFTLEDAVEASRYVQCAQLASLRQAIDKVAQPLATSSVAAVVSGSGEAVARDALQSSDLVGEVVSLSDRIGQAQSDCAAAAAVAALAEEM